jgi:DNA uptake protein ComE-like DNA-binding protein
MWKNDQRDGLSYLYFTRKERRATFWLLILLLIWPLGFGIWKHCFPPEFPDLSEPVFLPLSEPEEIASSPTPRFYFDPNQLSADSLQLLGIPDRAIRNILKYRAAGGRIQSLQKIYGFSPELAKSLQPWVRLQTKAHHHQPKTTSSDQPNLRVEGLIDINRASLDTLLAIGFSKRVANNLIRYRQAGGSVRDSAALRAIYGMTNSEFEQVINQIQFPIKPQQPIASRSYSPIDINQSDSLDWVQLPGIGPYFAGRILRFREKLGGFSSVDQVGTTWRLPDSTFQRIRPYLQPSPIFRKIDINSAPVAILAAHPYLNQKEATILVRYRENHGPFTGPDELEKVRVISSDKRRQLLPYLEFTNSEIQ